MNREDILQKAQNEGRGRDYADLEAQRKGAYVAYLIGIIILGIVVLAEWLVFDRISYGAPMAVFAMGFTAFLIKFIILRKRHELLVTVIYGVCTLIWLVQWIMQLCGVHG